MVRLKGSCRAPVARQAHNLEVGSSTPPSAAMIDAVLEKNPARPSLQGGRAVVIGLGPARQATWPDDGGHRRCRTRSVLEGAVSSRAVSVVLWKMKGVDRRPPDGLPAVCRGSSSALNRHGGTVVGQRACRLRRPLGRERSHGRYHPACARGAGSAVCVSRWRETPEGKVVAPVSRKRASRATGLSRPRREPVRVSHQRRVAGPREIRDAGRDQGPGASRPRGSRASAATRPPSPAGPRLRRA